MTSFTPYSALFGGILIGLSAALLMLCNGRIAGISGIVSGIVLPKTGDLVWRYSFIAGLVLGPPLFALLGMTIPAIQINGSWILWLSAGLLVGYGAKLSGGCTSGHGVCGLARFSLRSLAATLTFMTVAGLTVYVTRHVIIRG